MFLKKCINLLLSLCLLMVCAWSLAQAPAKVTGIKRQLIQYHDSGQYSRELSNIIREAMYYLQFRINQNSRLKHAHQLAMVLAIDEVVLSNYANMLRLSFGGTQEEIGELEAKGRDPSVSCTLTLFNYAREHGVSVFFVTRRKEYERAATVENLSVDGFRGWGGLYMEPNDYRFQSQEPFKSQMREAIEAKGYDIILNVGDQESDLTGGFADMALKLPNPYYRVG